MKTFVPNNRSEVKYDRFKCVGIANSNDKKKTNAILELSKPVPNTLFQSAEKQNLASYLG